MGSFLLLLSGIVKEVAEILLLMAIFAENFRAVLLGDMVNVAKVYFHVKEDREGAAICVGYQRFDIIISFKKSDFDSINFTSDYGYRTDLNKVVLPTTYSQVYLFITYSFCFFNVYIRLDIYFTF